MFMKYCIKKIMQSLSETWKKCRTVEISKNRIRSWNAKNISRIFPTDKIISITMTNKLIRFQSGIRDDDVAL